MDHATSRTRVPATFAVAFPAILLGAFGESCFETPQLENQGANLDNDCSDEDDCPQTSQPGYPSHGQSPSQGSQSGTGGQSFRAVSIKSAITKVQPMTGIVIWEDHWNSAPEKSGSEYIQLEYAYVKPSDIVTSQSTYDWSDFESFLNRIAARGHQAIVRFFYAYRGKETAVPAYIKSRSDYDETVGDSSGKETWFPDWTNAELQRFHMEFFSEFASRYDSDRRIAFLQVGFGLWGEYHIYDGPNTVGEEFPSKDFQAQFFRHMEKTFPTLHWAMSIDAGDSYYSPFEDDPSLLDIAFGNFDDTFMRERHFSYNETMWTRFGYEERHKVAPHGGELSYASDYDQEHALDAEGMYGRTYEELSSKFHITYIIGNDQPEHQSWSRIKEAGMGNGYKFEITSFLVSGTQAKVTVRNNGVAPIYYDAFVAVNGTRSNQSLKGLAPGGSQEYVVDAGGDAPALSIECDRLVSGQRIEFDANL